MRAKIRAKKTSDGYVMIAVLPSGAIEYPQEGKVHKTRSAVFADAAHLYSSSIWDYDPDKHTIDIS